MADKPRKPRRTTAQIVAEALANYDKQDKVIDCGEYGDDGLVPPAPEVQEKRKAGRPPEYDWTGIDFLFDWFLSDPGIREQMPQTNFILSIRNWYRKKYGKEAPVFETLVKELQKRRRLRA